MGSVVAQQPSGHVVRREGARGPVWYAKYRLPDGRQVQKRLGPAWTGRTRPPAGYVTKRAAEDWLAATLTDARRGTLPGLVRTGATVADAAAEYLRYIEHDRGRKPTTVNGYRWIITGQIVPALGERRLEDVTTRDVEAWIATMAAVKPSSRTQGARAPARDLPAGPQGLRPDDEPGDRCREAAADAERRHRSVLAGGDRALVRAAESEQDAAIFLTAAFTGLRMGELLALHWRDVDFAGEAIRVRGSYSQGHLTTPKSGKVRSVPLAPDVADGAGAARPSESSSPGEDDLVFAGDAGGHLDGSALRRRYTAALGRAGLRRLRFHDLRHTFGTRMIAHADIRRVQEWMGHADIQTTMKYLHYAPRAEDAKLVAKAFARRA